MASQSEDRSHEESAAQQPEEADSASESGEDEALAAPAEGMAAHDVSPARDDAAEALEADMGDHDPEARDDSLAGLPGASPPMDKIEDQELIEILEQLNETLDSAHSVLAEHQQLASGLVEPDQSFTPPLETPRSNSILTPLFAAALGAGIGIVALMLLWPVWTNVRNSEAIAGFLGPVESERLVARGVQIAPPANGRIDAMPLPEIQAEVQASVPPLPERKSAGLDEGNAKQAQGSSEDSSEALAAERVEANVASGLEDEALKQVEEKADAKPSELFAALPEQATAHTADVEPSDLPFELPEQVTSNAAVTSTPPPDGYDDKPDFEDKGELTLQPAPVETIAAAIEERPQRSPLTPEEETRFLEKGGRFLGDGDVASARLVYEYAALRGSADAMFALARTYDPRVLKETRVFGTLPDIDAALEWYGRAAEKGHDQADMSASELKQMTAR